MRKHVDLHLNRTAYCIVGQPCLVEPPGLFDRDKSLFEKSISHGSFLHESSLTESEVEPPKPSALQFGWLFEKVPEIKNDDERAEKIAALIRLGTAINDLSSDSLSERPNESDILSGYTYLGQFIAHEITFDNNQKLPDYEYHPELARSPQLDLDSLYGEGPGSEKSRHCYDEKNSALLKIGKTYPPDRCSIEFDNDLPRNDLSTALIPDPRNDENLAVAQLHVAFIRFHNFVVRRLIECGCPESELFDCARKTVTRHFHQIVLHDYLPKVLDRKGLRDVLERNSEFFNAKVSGDVFMPLEFSVAAFRFGHSLVRKTYEWNFFNSTSSNFSSSADVLLLFDQTEFSGRIGKEPRLNEMFMPRLLTDWVIDWRRFFDFASLPYEPPPTKPNLASRIDRVINMKLQTFENFNHHGLPKIRQPISVRNLLRGFAVGLTSGEFVADQCDEKPLSIEELSSGPYPQFFEILNHPMLRGQTPLWYYILKESELTGGKHLGRVGTKIVAETIAGLIHHSKHSILRDPEWSDPYSAMPNPIKSDFKMVDLLHLADVVDPIGKHRKKLYG